jgi:hypothetical protein
MNSKPAISFVIKSIGARAMCKSRKNEFLPAHHWSCSWAIASLAVFATMASADAASVNIEGRRYELPLPSGHCALDDANKRDAAVIRLMKTTQAGRNAVLLVFAPCAQLQAYRTGQLAAEGLSRNYWTALADDRSKPGQIRKFAPLTRSDYIKGWTSALTDPKRVRQGEDTAYNEMEQRLKQLGAQAQLSKAEMSLLAADQEAFYVAIIFGETQPGGKPQVYSIVSANTLIAGYGISVYLTEDPARPGIYRRLQAAGQTLIRGAIAANP